MRMKSSIFLVIFLLSACAGGAYAPPPPDASGAGGKRAASCKSGDQAVASASQCLQDDAACYALADGSYCTGIRGTTCPAGSTPMPAGSPCPQGMRCFAVSESLTCSVGY